MKILSFVKSLVCPEFTKMYLSLLIRFLYGNIKQRYGRISNVCENSTEAAAGEEKGFV